MIVSFSVPRMLPLIWNGLVQINEAKPGSVPQVRDRDLAAWMQDRRTEAKQFDFERVKRQTIRAIQSDHWFKVVDRPLAYMLDLYWKNQYAPERRRLATVPCRQAYLMTIERHDQGEGWDMTIDDDKSPLPDDYKAMLWHHDGFDTPKQFRDYFAPKPGGRFAGVILRW